MRKSEQNKKSGSRAGLWLFLFILAVSYAISAGASYFYLKDKFAFESAFIADIEARQKSARNRGLKKSSRLYAVDEQEDDEKSGDVSRKDSLLVVAEDIIRKYVHPYRVRLLDLYMDREGVIYIDFGGELKRNLNVDATEELRIIAGLYNSIKGTVPGFTRLKILINGREDDSMAGHIDISKPIGGEIASGI